MAVATVLKDDHIDVGLEPVTELTEGETLNGNFGYGHLASIT